MDGGADEIRRKSLKLVTSQFKPLIESSRSRSVHVDIDLDLKDFEPQVDII